ncbi:ChbG/HpnK family deacetylase [Streptococcus merionis]|uniref:ChbG/HpnK family deacetylase n=1 Tax=Streptococcus merionis TaxID=400065 RepID=UPI0026E95A93|nr:ChbG/HpnK family deacetylase [Streptococcus merionis]
MKKILVRADDLGYSEAVNYGIEKTIRSGIIRSAGVMTNMPAAEHGVELLKDLDVCLGLHTNICVGKPLCNPEKIPSLLQPSGEFRESKEFRSAKEDFVVLDEVIQEIEAQYERFVELTGKKPCYFEGHAVKSNNFFLGLEIVAKRYDCDYLAFSSDQPVKFRNTLLYPGMSLTMPESGTLPDPESSFLKSIEQNHGNDHIEMYVCHPGYIDAYLLEHSSLTIPRPMEVKMATSERVKEALDKYGIQVVTYSELD